MMDMLHAWMIAPRVLVPGVSAISRALDYSLKPWSALSRYLNDGAVPIDDNGVLLVNIQVICSDKHEHQRRVETRKIDIPGLTPPTWQSVLDHEYEAWEALRLI